MICLVEVDTIFESLANVFFSDCMKT